MTHLIYVVIHFSGREDAHFKQERLLPFINDFYDHYVETLGSGYFNVHFRTSRARIQCSLHLVAETDTFLVRGSDAHAEQAFAHALSILSSQVKTLQEAPVKNDILRFIHEPIPDRFTARI